MPYLDVEGDQLHFSDEGSGIPVVFVHGSCGGARQWKLQASSLQEHYRTICLDLLGSGQSAPWSIDRKWTFDIDEISVNAVLEYLDEPVHVIAHSGGCHFSYRSVAKRRDQILSLTYFEPTFFQLLRLDDDPHFAEPESMATSFRSAMEDNDPERAMAGFVDAWARAEGTWSSLPEAVKSMMMHASSRLYHEWLGPWSDEPSRGDLEALNTPVLLFKGSDTIDSIHRVIEITADVLPNCQTFTIDGAGHMSPFTHAEEALPVVWAHMANAES